MRSFRATSVMTFLLFIFPSYLQEFQKKITPWGYSCASANLPIQKLIFMRLRGGADEKESSDTGISRRFEDFPLEAPADNLAELLDKDTEEEEPEIDNVITEFGREPENITQPIPVRSRRDDISDSSEIEQPTSSVAEESFMDASNQTAVDEIRNNVAKRKSAR